MLSRGPFLPRGAVGSLIFTLGQQLRQGPRMPGCTDAIEVNSRGSRSHSFWSNSGSSSSQQDGRQINLSFIILKKGEGITASTS